MALSVVMLGLAELPVAIFLILIARRAREYETRSGHPASLLDASPDLQADRAAAEYPSRSIRSQAYTDRYGDARSSAFSELDK